MDASKSTYLRGVCIHGDCLADAVRGSDFCSTHTPSATERGRQLYERLRQLSNELHNCDRDVWEDIGQQEQECWNRLAGEVS